MQWEKSATIVEGSGTMRESVPRKAKVKEKMVGKERVKGKVKEVRERDTEKDIVKERERARVR